MIKIPASILREIYDHTESIVSERVLRPDDRHDDKDKNHDGPHLSNV